MAVSGSAATAATTHNNPLAAACETEADQLIARELSKMLPNQNHPLTRAYMLGARSTTTAAYAEALHLIRACETGVDQLTIDQCKLAAEVMIERKMP